MLPDSGEIPNRPRRRRAGEVLEAVDFFQRQFRGTSFEQTDNRAT